jgi:hypothetical protein
MGSDQGSMRWIAGSIVMMLIGWKRGSAAAAICEG